MKNPQQKSSTLKVHCFICTRCEGGQVLRDATKELVKQQLPDKPVRINASGCLGMCDNGIASIFYPHGVVLIDLDQQKAPHMLETIKNLLGQPVE